MRGGAPVVGLVENFLGRRRGVQIRAEGRRVERADERTRGLDVSWIPNHVPPGSIPGHGTVTWTDLAPCAGNNVSDAEYTHDVTHVGGPEMFETPHPCEP